MRRYILVVVSVEASNRLKKKNNKSGTGSIQIWFPNETLFVLYVTLVNPTLGAEEKSSNAPYDS